MAKCGLSLFSNNRHLMRNCFVPRAVLKLYFHGQVRYWSIKKKKKRYWSILRVHIFGEEDSSQTWDCRDVE